MRIIVGIPTTGRADILSETLVELSRQTRLPDRVVICPVKSEDIELQKLSSLPYAVDVTWAKPGLPTQRNAILRSSEAFDAIIFLDDDFFPSQSYIANAEALLTREPQVVLATGALIEDGINGPGLQVDYVRKRLDLIAPPRHDEGPLQPVYGAYGCNMVIRLEPVLRNKIRFDEVLPLYAWQEDIDFSRQIAPFGRIVRSPSLTGVHLGVKRGRNSGLKLGYSQIANPIYLIRKGTMSIRIGTEMMLRNLMANTARSFAPESHVDRFGRLKGNMLAIGHLFRGQLHPRRIFELD